LAIFSFSKKTVLLLLSAFIIQGCGVKFWYNRLDWLVPWYVDDYVELTESQEKQLESVLQIKTSWHRKQQLPNYVEWLKGVRHDLQSGDIKQSYDKHRDKLASFYDILLNELVAEMTVILVEFTPEQTNELIDTLAESDSEWLEEFQESDQQEQLKNRQKNIENSLKEWIGKLTIKQKEISKAWASEQLSTVEERLAFRKRWRDALQYQLSRDVNPENEKKLQQLFLNNQQFQSDLYKRQSNHNQQVAKRYLMALYDTLTKKQKRKLLSKLEDYHEDFSELIAEEE